MRLAAVTAAGLLTLAPASIAAQVPAPPDQNWRAPDPEQTVLFETSRGPIIVELAPALAPKAAERVRALVRGKTYDGLLFHRVIDGFVAQTGNPNNRDGGGTSLPNLPAEFTFRTAAGLPNRIVARRSDAVLGFAGAQAFEAQPPLGASAVIGDGPPTVRGWGAFCAGVVGMGRQSAPDSANSEIFFLRAPSRRLDHEYTAVGVVLIGLDVVRALAVGEPPAKPDRIGRARLLADIPEAERPRLRVADPLGPLLGDAVAQARARTGGDFSVCDVQLPVLLDR